ncbi:hypothetical protein EAX61_10760 [Dokdonia sinensis]|uniref:Lipoprotein n=1 Tax=Dokdonia sinensis TaxID=2479847 RepID=A0A3M0FY21_9FLAO|nr:hypothetical protein [Dokdonia sinensis]RMB57591.1 hypothetical protein EAX61_10760 [Dokdonia sinensis]
MNIKKLLYITLYACAITLLLLATSCVSTRVEANPYQDSAENIACQKESSWSYFWGLKQKMVSANPEIPDTTCPCAEKAMSWVVTKSSFGDFMLSLVTLGTVNHRTVTYGCARPRDGDGGLDD